MRAPPKSRIVRLDSVDPTFDPWEQSRPIPVFVLAIFLALAIWGALSYLADLAPNHGVDLGGTATANRIATVPDPGAPALVTRGTASAWACASCHGARGEGAGPTPALAGLSDEYIVKQLEDFRSGGRLSDSMRYVAAQLDVEQIAEVARYYARLPRPTVAATDLGGDTARGAVLFREGDWKRDIPACATCHGQNGEGVGAQFPRLAGQQPEYVLGQLAAWKGGYRHNSPQALMDDIAARLSDSDMRDAAQYLGSLNR